MIVKVETTIDMSSFKQYLCVGASVCVCIFLITIQFNMEAQSILKRPQIESAMHIMYGVSMEPSLHIGSPNGTRSPCQPDKRFVSSNWYNEYATKVHSVKERPPCEDCIKNTMNDICSRWWHTTPQRSYRDHPPRVWSGVFRTKDQNISACEFGQAFHPEMKCAAKYRHIFQTLDNLRVVYFPRSGTELGVVRGSAYLSADGDVDLHVDMPQKMLLDKLKDLLDPAPHMSGDGATAEVHWQVSGCPEVHLVYNDWISDELKLRAKPEDLCRCRINSVDLLCHRDGLERMLTQYGPSWMVPLGVKLLDMPYWAKDHPTHSWTKNLASKLRNLINKSTGRIEEEAVSKLMDQTEVEMDKEMPLVLAQLNVLAASLDLL